MKIKLSQLLFILFIVLLLAPVILWISWLATDKKPINILIVDKTVLTKKGVEHSSFNWYLKNRKYVKPDNTFYLADKDYMGFFPLADKKYTIHDLQHYNKQMLDSITDTLDMVYYTDTYGIYYNEWFRDSLQTEHSRKIYGGLGKKDVAFLKRMKDKHKLILAEFNFLASPTTHNLRRKAEKILDIRWTGWTLNHFDILDTLKNKELPRWITKLYKDQHNGKWPFKKSGIVFVNENSRIEILQENKDLIEDYPIISSEKKGRDTYHMPEQIRYPYWIDITYPANDSMEVLAYYEIHGTPRGDSILKHAHIPSRFPAVMAAKSRRMFYFSGDYADNRIGGISVYFKWIDRLKKYIFREPQKFSRKNFYWEFYYPMIDAIMQNNYKSEKLKLEQ